MSELPRIVVKIEQHAVDRQWPFAEWTVSTNALIFQDRDGARQATEDLRRTIESCEAGVMTVYLETPVDTTHSIVKFGQLLSSESAVRNVIETITRWSELYLPASAVRP